MKIFTIFILLLITFLPIRLLSQKVDRINLDSTYLLSDRIIFNSYPIEQKKFQSKSDDSNDKKSRTIANKKILDNGFLLIEKLSQYWDGLVWFNNKKLEYTYNGNNMIEELYQKWEDALWVNYTNRIYAYDGNSNLIEEIYQGSWDGSN